MRLLCRLLACFLLGMFLVSCTPETDFLISSETAETQSVYDSEMGISVVINKNSFKYHLNPNCIYVSRMSSANRLDITVSDTAYLKECGYSACSGCAGEK